MDSGVMLDSVLWIPVLMDLSDVLSSLGSRAWNIVQVAAGLGFVIFIHELGHFLAAKLFGVKCEKFYVGFDPPMSIGPIKLPRTLGKFQWGETEYGIGIIPLGGYVKMLGQDDDPRNAKAEAERIRVAASGENGEPEVIEKTPLDPRSFPAKPVYARMIIISAGVIMNLLSAVVLAAIAYSFGVPYSPAVIGNVTAGDPAWQAGLRQGDKVVQIGTMSEPDEQLGFRELTMQVALSGFRDSSKPVPVTIERDGQQIKYEIVGTTKHAESDQRKILQIGVAPPTIFGLARVNPFPPSSALANLKLDLKPGDKIIALNGEALPVDTKFGEILGFEFTNRLQAKWRDPVTATVERKDEKGSVTKHDVTLPAVRLRTFGFGFVPGPVTSVAKGSVAEKAGIEIGDELSSVDGQAITDGWTLPLLIAEKAEKSNVEVLFKRKTADGNAPKEILVTIAAGAVPGFDPVAEIAPEASVRSLGVAYSLTNTIGSIEPGSAAEKSGVNVGDKLTQIQFPQPADLPEAWRTLGIPAGKKEIDNKFNIVGLCTLSQILPLGLKVDLYFEQSGMVKTVPFELAESNTWYWYIRGLPMRGLQQQRVAGSFGEAMSLGVTETGRRLWEVLDFLSMLVTGRVPIWGLGGPIRIVQAASMEASEGTSSLLIFLTLLSANLVIINFLPIPGLDGGHMTFLTAEAVSGRPVNESWQIALTMAGVLCLLCLMAFVILNDLWHIAV